jgi:protein O-GlcNAc transferase
LQPDHLAAINERGIVLAEMREHSKALAAFQKAISLNPTFADAHVNMANLLGEAGRHQEAKSIFEKSLALNPKLARAWSGLGNTLRAIAQNLRRLAKLVARPAPITSAACVA